MLPAFWQLMGGSEGQDLKHKCGIGESSYAQSGSGLCEALWFLK